MIGCARPMTVESVAGNDVMVAGPEAEQSCKHAADDVRYRPRQPSVTRDYDCQAPRREGPQPGSDHYGSVNIHPQPSRLGGPLDRHKFSGLDGFWMRTGSFGRLGWVSWTVHG